MTGPIGPSIMWFSARDIAWTCRATPFSRPRLWNAYTPSTAIRCSPRGSKHRRPPCTLSGRRPPGASGRSCGSARGPNSRVGRSNAASRKPKSVRSSPSDRATSRKRRMEKCDVIDPRRPGAPGSPGAVVVGGDYQGLGIVRSLGRRGVPVCVVDDEHSIARFSRYATHSVSTASLRDERQTVEILLDVGHRLDLKGWVLYPTRDETVAAFARERAALSEWFRVPTPGWKTMQWVWDKRNTYRLAREIGIATPQTWYPRERQDLDEIRADGPFALKP